MSAVLYEKRGQVAWVRINRPQARNTMDGEVFVLLAEAWEAIRRDAGVRVAVLTATGKQDFSCGGDLAGVIPLWTGAREPATDIERKLLANPTLVDDVMLKRQPLYKPLIGAINGRALGGGFEIMLATDIRLAAASATFGVPEPRAGVVPGAGTMARLARQIPYAHAMRLLLTGESVDAATALQFGLVSEVVPDAELEARAAQVAEVVAGNAPLALSAIKRTVIDSHTLPWEDAFRLEMEQSAGVMMSADAREGPRAFKEKRRPVFTGK